uniref:Integrase catalytic domain-containing protein n=1 Tax=Plectus sambesii TaxID=2011161 RepID=A0A914UMV2_9BILA
MHFSYLQVLITDQGIDHRVTSAYHPQSNGLTKHTNQTIKKGLRKTLEGRHKEWPKFVNRVLYGIHLHRPRSTRQLPYKLLYGFDARFSLNNKLDQLNQVPEDDAVTTEEADDERLRVFLQGVDKHNEEIDNCRSEARENIVIEQSKQKTTYDAAHAACPFKVGSKVLLHSSRQLTRMAKQLEENFTGPYIIHRLTKANTAYLTKMDGTVLKKTVSCAQLKLFIDKPASTAVTITINKSSDESKSEAYDSPPAK